MSGFVETAPPEAEVRAEPFVRVEAVSYRFGTTEALAEVSFSVEEARICGLIGSDGAGKSTLLKMLATMLKPASGRIIIGGRDLCRHRASIKQLIGYMPQRFGLYQDLTVEENFEFFLDIFGIQGEERQRRKAKYLGFANLLSFADRPAGKLSGGMKQKLGLACVLSHEPRLLILDEPTNGVDPVSRREFWEILGRMQSAGMTIVISTAYLDEGERCDYLGLMHRGKLLSMATPAVLREGFASLEEAVIQRIGRADQGLLNDGFKL